MFFNRGAAGFLIPNPVPDMVIISPWRTEPDRIVIFGAAKLVEELNIITKKAPIFLMIVLMTFFKTSLVRPALVRSAWSRLHNFHFQGEHSELLSGCYLHQK
jgi:hypothetical protein